MHNVGLRYANPTYEAERVIFSLNPLNHRPRKFLDWKTPHEVFFGQPSTWTKSALNVHFECESKESFGQLWDYKSEAWARRFFENWKASLKWQRLKPYEKFAAMIERHWGGIAAHCRPENKVSLGFVEGLNNKIRVIQRRAYGLHDAEYLRLKVLTCMLPKI